MKNTSYTHRLMAKFAIEATTPLAVGNGQSAVTTDALVVTDINGLPCIPGTSIAGVLRHAMEQDGVEDFFGFQEGKKGHGSRVIISDAVMIGKTGVVLDGIQSIDFDDDFYVHFKQLPIRQHVKINHRGAAEKGGKFDNQVVFKGTRFFFEIEMVSNNSDELDSFKKIINHVFADDFRLGGGTRNGLGRFRVVDAKMATLNLCKPEDLESYLNKKSSLNDEWNCYEPYKPDVQEDTDALVTYSLKLSAKDFFLFGSGLPDDEADMTPVTEYYIEWKNGKPTFQEGTLLPGTSIKGALSHRTAFYWNKLNGFYADEGNGKTGDENPAVVALFGCSGEGKDSAKIKRGNVMIDDVIVPSLSTKIVNHVAIDRFTGGALDGALFSEKVNDASGQQFNIDIIVNSCAFKEDVYIKQAFEKALEDLRTGMLPLGGGVNRGNGIFYETK